MNHKRILILFVALLAMLVSVSVVTAQGPTIGSRRAPRVNLGTAFTYQGQLKKNGAPVNATCDFQFSLFADAAGSIPVGSTYPVNNVLVANGLFTATINFGANAFTGDAR